MSEYGDKHFSLNYCADTAQMVLLIRKISRRPPTTQLVKIGNIIYLTLHLGNSKPENNPTMLFMRVFFQT